MKKIKINIGVIGYLPFEFDRTKILNWESEVFEIVGDIEDYHFNNNSDTMEWGYSDEILARELPNQYEGDFFVGITYVPIEDNFYARRLSNNRLILSYFEMFQILKCENIPVENLLLRVLYSSIIVYQRNEQTIPKTTDWIGFTHDDTRGCLFDMNGNKSDVVFSLDSPTICDKCITNIREDKVSDNCISTIKKEIQKIKKERFYKISEFVKRKPVLSIVISLIFGVLVSLTATVIYEIFLRNMINAQHSNVYTPCPSNFTNVSAKVIEADSIKDSEL
ncbi:hypothetical protein EYV94_27490 [Puteibacter caeruleilacunae]|nr:hypothetical protein EYV94_27490 [Puteibacter caeruleilacunae]